MGGEGFHHCPNPAPQPSGSAPETSSIYVSASSQERYERTQERSEKRRRSECASALLELSHQSTDDMLVKADASSSVEERVKITNDYITGLEVENTSLKEKLKLNSLRGIFQRGQ